jgi:hypothetical protein
MKFEFLIWIIIFIIFVGFSVFKRMRSALKAGENKSDKQESGWKERVDQFLSQVQRVTGEKDLLVDQEQGWKDISSNTIDPAVEKRPLPEQKPAIPKAFAERTDPPISGSDISPIYLDIGIQDLRKAVIWSEILAPPLALRDKRPK